MPWTPRPIHVLGIFIKKGFHGRCFPGNFAKSYLEHLSYENPGELL